MSAADAEAAAAPPQPQPDSQPGAGAEAGAEAAPTPAAPEAAPAEPAAAEAVAEPLAAADANADGDAMTDVAPAVDSGASEPAPAPAAAPDAASAEPAAAVASEPAQSTPATDAPAADDAAVADASSAMNDVAAADSSATAAPAPAEADGRSSLSVDVAPAAPAAAAAPPAAAAAAPPSSAPPASPSQLLSPRKSARAVHLTPKMEALGDKFHLASVAPLALPDAAPATPAPAPAVPATHPHDVWMTPHQAAIENKRLKANCGWKFVPVGGKPHLTPLLAAAAGVDLSSGRQARQSTKADGDTPPATPAPAGKKGRASVAPSGKKGSKRKASGEFTPTGDPALDEKQRQLAALAEQIEALKNQEKSILSGTPLPSTPLAFPSTPAPPAAAPATPSESKKRAKLSAPTPVSIPSTPAFSRQSSLATPGATPATPSTSRTGRAVKAPQHFADEQEPAGRPRSLGTHLKSCRKLLEHLAAHKASQGIFAWPVNYSDPSKQYFAPNYLEAIGSDNRPMDLGTIRTKLTNFEYGTMWDFAADVRMVYRNAMLYNPEGEWIHKAAADCMRIFEREMKRIEELPERTPRVHEEEDEEHEHRRSTKKQNKRTKELQHLRSSLPDMHGDLQGRQQDLLEAMTARILALEAKLQQTAPMPTPVPVQPIAAAYSPVARPAPTPVYRPERDTSSVSTHHARTPSAPSRKSSGPPASKPLSQAEKQQLKEDIFKLPPHKLTPVVDIISRSMPPSEQKDDAEEMEIDIDKLEIHTLREMQAYVKKALQEIKRGKPLTTPAARRPTPKTQPKASPGTGARPPTGASPAHHAPRTSPAAAAAIQSPSRLDLMPQTPNMGRATSQAVGNTTPALKYISSSDDSSDSDSDSDDDAGHGASHAPAAAAADDAPAPSILDVNQTAASDSSSDDDDADTPAPAWSNVPATQLAPPAAPVAAPAASAAASSLWGDFQVAAEQAKEKSRALAELEAKRLESAHREHAQLHAAGEERKRAADAEDAARAAAEARAAEEKRAKLEADRDAARRAREARAAGVEPSPQQAYGYATEQANIMHQMDESGLF